MRLRWLIKEVTDLEANNERFVLDYAVMILDDSSNRAVEIKDIKVDHFNKAIVISS